MEPVTNNQPAWINISEVELIYKTKIKNADRPQIHNTQESSQLFRQFWDPAKIDLLEEFKVLFLNRANRVLGIYQLSTGGVTGTVADVRLILAMALKVMASAIILCHNHPSGNPKPSRADEELTKKIKDAATLHDMKLFDHLILTSEDYLSFADEGLL